MESIDATRKPGPLRLFFAAVVALSLIGVMACSSDEGRTPDCQPDVDQNGHKDVQNPCNPFGKCIVNGNEADPAQCCTDKMGSDLDYCLCAYGVLDKCPSTGNSSGGGGSGGGP